MKTKTVKNRICLSTLGVLAGLLLVLLRPMYADASTIVDQKTVTHIHTDTSGSCYKDGTVSVTGTATGTLCQDSHNEWNCGGCGEHITEETYSITYYYQGYPVKSDSGSRRSCSYSSNGCHANPYDNVPETSIYGTWSVHGRVLNCTHTGETLGTLYLNKERNQLSISTTTNPFFTIVSYTWYGKATGSTANVTATGVGDAFCNVKIKDKFNNVEQTVQLKATMVASDFYTATITANRTTSNTSWTNEDVTLTCTTSGDTTASYQWYKGSTPIAGATTSTLVVSEYDSYYCIATATTSATARSNAITVYVDKTPPSGSVTTSQTSTWTSSATLTALVTDTPSGIASYSWSVTNGTGYTYTGTSSQLTLTNTGIYTGTVTVTDKASNSVTLDIPETKIDSCTPIVSIKAYTSEKEITSADLVCKDVTFYAIDSESHLCDIHYTWKRNGVAVGEDTNYIIETSEGDNITYTVTITTESGLSSTSTFIVNIDKTPPVVTYNVNNMELSLNLADNKTLNNIDIYHDGTLVNSFSLTGTSDTKTIDLSLGNIEFRVFDTAGNKTIHSTDVKTLDEPLEINHVHAFNKSLITVNGVEYATSNGMCYTNGQSVPNIVYKDGQLLQEGYTTKYALTCSHTNEIIGTMTLIKTTDTGEYVLGIDSALTHVTIQSYKWYASENASTEEFPSVHPNGHTVAEADGATTASIIVPDFGLYTCNVVYRDDISGLTKTAVFTYKVNDFDLTPPEVDRIEWVEGSLVEVMNKDSDAFSEDISFKYRNSKLYTIYVTDNMNLSKLVEEDGTEHLLSGQMDDVSFEYTENGTYTYTLIDMINNSYTFDVVIDHIDVTKPRVVTIEDKIYNEVLEFDSGNDAFSEKENTDTPFATAYKESTTLTFSCADNARLMRLTCTSGNLTLNKEITDLTDSVDVTFTENDIYEFDLYDEASNIYSFSVEIRYIDKDNPVIGAFTSTPDYMTKSGSYTLQVASTDFSKMYYKWLRKDNETNAITVYKDWNSEPFVTIKKNGAYAVLVADSVYYNVTETEPEPTYDYLSRGGHKHISTYNTDFNDPKLNYYYCDTTPPIVTYELRPTPKYVIVTITAHDNQDKADELKYACDKPIKQDKNIFYVTENGTYTYTVTDLSENSASVSVYIDFDELTGSGASIIKDLDITPLGTYKTYEGITYSNTGFTYTPVYKDFVDTNYVLTKWNKDGTYKKTYSYTINENSSAVLYSRYTLDETENTGEIEYQTKIQTIGVDKEAPTLSISVKNKVAYITTSDKLSGVGRIEVETMTTSSKVRSYVNYSDKRNTEVNYALPMELNTIYGIKIFDNVGNEGIQYYVSTDGVLKGGISNLYVVIFVDGYGHQISEQYLIKGANAVAPDAPEKTGCTFEKWSCDFTNVHSNLLVYPVFRSNVTGLILDEEILYDEALRMKLKDSGFMFSQGGTGELDEEKAERRTIENTVFLQESIPSKQIINLTDADAPRAYMRKYVYKYSGASLLLLLLAILVFKEWQERKRIE